MKNCDLLLKRNTGYSLKVKNIINNGVAVFKFHDSSFDGKTVKKILGKLNGFEKTYGNRKIPIYFNFTMDKMEIVDKLSYVLFECICYYLTHFRGHLVKVFWKPKDTIWTQGVFASPLLKLNVSGKPNIQDFEKLFNKDIYKTHYRKVVSGNDKLDTNYLGDMYQEIDSFLKMFDVRDDYRDRIANMCSELVGNAGEHSGADCLIDIDVTSDHGKKVEGEREKGEYYAINIAVVNFADNLIGDDLRRLMTDCKEELGERYRGVRLAYQMHSRSFSDKYDEEDFYNISVFQDRISGRGCNSQTGGTGLTLLIKNMQDCSESATCYMISGNKSIFFRKDLLEYDENGWIGFNKEKNYFRSIPDENMFGGCYIYMPGTAYNLNFILKREEMINE